MLKGENTVSRNIFFTRRTNSSLPFPSQALKAASAIPCDRRNPRRPRRLAAAVSAVERSPQISASFRAWSRLIFAVRFLFVCLSLSIVDFAWRRSDSKNLIEATRSTMVKSTSEWGRRTGPRRGGGPSSSSWSSRRETSGGVCRLIRRGGGRVRGGEVVQCR